MRYLVIGNAAVLASRDIEYIETDGSEGGEKDIAAEICAVPDGASFSLQKAETVKTYAVTSGIANVPVSELDNGVWEVSVRWSESDGETAAEREAFGNPIKLYGDEGSRKIIPAPLASGTEMEKMWNGIVNAYEFIAPIVDTIKNGNDVV